MTQTINQLLILIVILSVWHACSIFAGIASMFPN